MVQWLSSKGHTLGSRPGKLPLCFGGTFEVPDNQAVHGGIWNQSIGNHLGSCSTGALHLRSGAPLACGGVTVSASLQTSYRNM